MNAAVPRVELHCHLDASVRLATIGELSDEQGISLPGPLRGLAVAQPGDDLRAYIGRIDVALDVLQTSAALERASRELVEDWHRDGVIHGEVRFAPQLHTRRGLTMQEVLAAVHSGLSEVGETLGVGTVLILCFLRHQDPRLGLDVAELAASNRDLVAAVDLSGDEDCPAAPFAPAFEIARDAGLHITVHAGEAGGPQNVREALDDLGAQRIGHGVRSAYDDELVERLARDRIPLEMCPQSNVQTGAVASLRAHPIRTLLERGVRVTVSTDARTVSDTSLDREFELLRTVHGWTLAEERLVQRFAAEAAFVSGAIRERLLNDVERQLVGDVEK